MRVLHSCANRTNFRYLAPFVPRPVVATLLHEPGDGRLTRPVVVAMAPLITLYILAGCVGVAALLFIVMIVITALRPPQLPELSQLIIEPPAPPPAPLQRVIRALTPVPIVATPQPAVVAVPRAAVTTPRAAAPMPRAVVPAQPAIIRPAAPRPIPAAPAAPAPVARRPVYPVKRTRPLLRFVVGLVVTTIVAAGAVVAYPALLDAPCDDYEWFGADAAQVVRGHARDAHATIVEFVELVRSL